MRFHYHAVSALLFAGAALLLTAQQPPSTSGVSGANGVGQAASSEARQVPPAAQSPLTTPSLTVDRDPVRSPDGEPPAPPAVLKLGEGYVLHTDVDEVDLNCTVLEGKEPVPDLIKEDFEVLEDGVPQTFISFLHTDLPVSIALVVDNSGSMSTKRRSVNKSTLDLIQASNPQDEAFVVNFSDEAFIDQDFTSDVNKLREGLSHIEARGGTALYDAVAASADHLASDAKHSKQVIVLITDGDDNASTISQNQAIRRVQQLSGPVIYSIGLLFGDEDMSRSEVKEARKALEMLSTETGGMAFFPKNIEEVDQIAAEVARDIRNQYVLGYHSTKPTGEPGFRRVEVTAKARHHGRLTVRTRTGYFPTAGFVRQEAFPERH
jgi:VWFA-related protein